jgi:ABC-type polysaccharide/polyol phosphate export permease
MRYEGVSPSAFIYDCSKRGSLALEELRGAWHYRDLILQLVRRDLVARYKRSVLGIAWTMLNPLGMMLILTFVFSQLFHSIQGYPVYILSGLIAWNFFSQTTSAALSQNVWGGSLLHKIYLPRTSFTLSAIGTGLANLVISIVPLLLIMLITGFPMKLSMLFLPVAMIILGCFALGLGLLISTLALYFPDVVEMYQVILIAWMYLTPIIYPADIIPAAIRPWLVHLNPMAFFVQIFRQPVYEGNLPSMQELLPAIAIALVTLFVGWLVFSSKANEFTYRT